MRVTYSLLRRLGLRQLGSAALAALLFVATPAFSGDLWQVEKMSGDVRILSEGLQLSSFTPHQSLAEGSVIETGPGGRVMLTRGEESIFVSPNSAISLAPTSARGMATTILQKAGTILLSVEKKARRHFEVETPYLAAVVKGTKFTVAVDPSGAAVHVVEGAVEVLDLDTGDVGMVRPGQTAQSLAGSGFGLVLDGPGVGPVERHQSRSRTGRVAPSAPEVKGAAASVKKSRIVLAVRSGMSIEAATNNLARSGRGQADQSALSTDDDAPTSDADQSAQTGNGVARGQGGGNGGGAGTGAPSAAGGSPGNSGGSPGNSGNAPGLSGGSPGNSGGAPGNSGSAPGLGGGSPGNSGSAPGLAGGGSPGNSGNAPGLGGGSPGNSGDAPGQGGGNPGRGKGNGKG